ncbi:hypothetical protein A8F19_19715 [Burkholderia cenocepacia]|nr:hypothetical protein A8F19_19715 [Burkholderia cenocepacia]
MRGYVRCFRGLLQAVQLSMRRPLNVVVVALANKIARTIWALLAHGRSYCESYPPPVTAA